MNDLISTAPSGTVIARGSICTTIESLFEVDFAYCPYDVPRHWIQLDNGEGTHAVDAFLAKEGITNAEIIIDRINPDYVDYSVRIK